MRKKNVYNSIIGGILAAVMLLSFAGCGNSNLPVDSTDDISISTNSSEAESSSENVENVGYEFPAGAESEYALYTAVVDYLNNGFHADELKDIQHTKPSMISHFLKVLFVKTLTLRQRVCRRL